VRQMNRQIMFPIAVLAAISLAAGGVMAKPAVPTRTTASTFSGHQLASQARVSLAAARAIALAARPGVITAQELEREKGGSGLRYSFDLRSAGLTYEVGVDAKSGQVLENGREAPHAD
jgi:uncharacterized membrane protein YkoI